MVCAVRDVLSGSVRLLGRGGRAWNLLETSLARRSWCICNILADYF